MKYWLIMTVALLLSFNAAAVIETYQFDDDVQRVRYHHFIEELRCPKCQNQNLSGSDSAISQDLRRQIHSMIMDDKSDIEITQFMVARYGDFILYRPRFNATTAILWLAPMGLLGIGLLVWWRMASRQNVIKSQPDSPLSIAEQAKLASLLTDDKQGEQP
jgi:cytochrome c-type biogenesis protein CcmH